MTGKAPFGTPPPDDLTREQRALLRMVGDGLGPKTALMRGTSVPEGIPVRLISSRQTFLPEESEQEAWWRSHEDVVDSIPGAVLVEAGESGHMVPWDQPELVIRTIVEVVEAIRPHQAAKAP